MINNILEMLKLAEHFNSNEIIATAKGKYELPKTYKEIFKKALKWQLKKIIGLLSHHDYVTGASLNRSVLRILNRKLLITPIG